jgi:UDP-N-acetylmuramoylalanine--D-glutamate ligase
VAGCAALNSIQANRILLIAGGSDKKLDLTPFAKAVAERSAAVALLSGTATENLAALIGKQGAGDKILGIHDNLRAAVFELLNKSRPGDVIMLSPGCASFGMFLNEYHRGNTFIEIVNEILN